MEEEEKRKNEWFVEREANIVSPHNQVMPWARGCEEDDRFRRSLRSSILASIILALLVSVIDIPIPERSAVIKVPERVAKLVREERMLPKPVAEPTVPDEPVVDTSEQGILNYLPSSVDVRACPFLVEQKAVIWPCHHRRTGYSQRSMASSRDTARRHHRRSQCLTHDL